MFDFFVCFSLLADYKYKLVNVRRNKSSNSVRSKRSLEKTIHFNLGK